MFAKSKVDSQLEANTFHIAAFPLQARVRGKIDSNGCVTGFLEERLNLGLNFILSAEVRYYVPDLHFVGLQPFEICYLIFIDTNLKKIGNSCWRYW